jgi:hypothetical protein
MARMPNLGYGHENSVAARRIQKQAEAKKKKVLRFV